MTYEFGKNPWEIRTQKGGATQSALFNIPFWIEPQGKVEDGSGMGLPAPLLDALDLEIENTFDTTSATIGFATSGHTIDVGAWLYDVNEPVSQLENKQFRVIQNKHDYTSVASGNETFGLTLDDGRLLRRLYVNCYEHGIAENVDITDIQLKRNNDEIFMGKWDQIQAMNAQHCNLNFCQHIFTTAESTTDVIFTRIPNLRFGSYSSFGATNRDDTEYVNSITAGDITMANTDAAPGELVLLANEVPTLAVVDFDLYKDLSEMVRQGVTSLDCILTNGGADGEVKIAEESITKMW